MPESSDGERMLVSEVLDQQLAAARDELEALEQAVHELPEIFEAKFRQGVAAVVEINRQLLTQQVLLQRECAALPPAQCRSVWSWLSLRLPRLQLSGVPMRQLVAPGLAAVGIGLLVFGATRWLQTTLNLSARRLDPVPVRQVSAAGDGTLVLRANGTSWVEVQDLSTREVILIGELNAGDERTIRMRHGLRMRSGRPDLLFMSVNGGQAQPFGTIQGTDWRNLLPPSQGSR